MCKYNNIKYFEIKEINNVYKWIGKEYKRIKARRFA